MAIAPVPQSVAYNLQTASGRWQQPILTLVTVGMTEILPIKSVGKLIAPHIARLQSPVAML
jgi:hypothetical protein